MKLKYKDIVEGIEVTKEIELHYINETFKPPYLADNNIIEIDIIPSINGIGYNTKLQSKGISRAKSTMRLLLDSYTEYNEIKLIALWNKKCILEIPGEGIFHCIISDLGTPDGYPYRIECDIELLEVNDSGV